MSSRHKLETLGGSVSEAITYEQITEHLRLAAEACYTLGHLRKANGDELVGQGFLAIGQMLEKNVDTINKLATSPGKIVI